MLMYELGMSLEDIKNSDWVEIQSYMTMLEYIKKEEAKSLKQSGSKGRRRMR